jgi:hypothetical protein
LFLLGYYQGSVLEEKNNGSSIYAIFMGKSWCFGISAFPQPGPIQHVNMSFPSTFLMAIGLPQWFGAACVAPHFWHFKVTAFGQSAGGFMPPIPFVGFIIGSFTLLSVSVSLSPLSLVITFSYRPFRFD